MDKSIIEFLQKKQITVIGDKNIETNLKVWEQWYKGKVDDFHSYKIYTGKRKIKQERKTLNMGQEICHKWADLLLNEKVNIHCSDKSTEERLKDLLMQVNFYVRGNNLVERAFAYGGGFFIQYWDGNKTNQDYISQEMMFPISFDSGRLTEVAFASKKVINQKPYVYISVHQLDYDKTYVLKNIIAERKKKSVKEAKDNIYEALGLEKEWHTGSTTPLFEMIKPNVANKDDFNSPFGTSIFAGSIDVLKTLDCVYDSLFNEFTLGRKRIFVKDGISRVQPDEDGKMIQVFDPQDVVFYSLPDEEDTKPITEINPELRVEAHNNALEKNLAELSNKCGFGSNGFKWENSNVSTATQIISENSVMFRAIKKHEILLNEALIGMAKGLLTVESKFGDPQGINLDAEITIDFDDSIIEDTSEIRRQALLELNAGIIDKAEYLMITRNMSEGEAIDFVAKIDARNKVEEEPATEEFE